MFSELSLAGWVLTALVAATFFAAFYLTWRNWKNIPGWYARLKFEWTSRLALTIALVIGLALSTTLLGAGYATIEGLAAISALIIFGILLMRKWEFFREAIMGIVDATGWIVVITTLVVAFTASLFLIGGIETISLFLALAFFTGSFIFAIWQLAKNDTFFTFVGRGDIKTIDRGKDNVIRVLANLGDEYHVEDMKIVLGPPSATWLQRKFGLYWMGIPPAEVHEFEFVHERINPNITDKTPASQWIIRDPNPKKHKTLLFRIPHEYRFVGVELKDGFRIDVLVNTMLQVYDPITALYTLRGKFIDYTARYVEGGAIQALKKYTAEEWRELPKDETSDLAKEILASIDPDGVAGLSDTVGLRVVSTFISKYDASDKSEEEALAKKKRATLDGEAAIESARLEANKAVEEAKRIRTLADAEAYRETAGLTATLKTIKEQAEGVDSTTLVENARAMVVATKMSHPDSNVQVLGAGVNVGFETKRRE